MHLGAGSDIRFDLGLAAVGVDDANQVALGNDQAVANPDHHALDRQVLPERLGAVIRNLEDGVADADLGAMLELNLEAGRMNLKVMEMLDKAHTETYGQPRPAVVKEGTQGGHGILVTGHDMKNLELLLKACEGTEVKVYTHGEMLPAHMYPKLREHPNLAGHYGGAWQKQKQEFPKFPGPVIATTLVLLAVFLPAAFSGGITGALNQQFALTIAAATVISSINALTLSPALSAIILRPMPLTDKGAFGVFNRGFDAATLGEATRKVFEDRHGGDLAGRYRVELEQVAAAYRSVAAPLT